jgi:hypothetical protein
MINNVSSISLPFYDSGSSIDLFISSRLQIQESPSLGFAHSISVMHYYFHHYVAG